MVVINVNVPATKPIYVEVKDSALNVKVSAANQIDVDIQRTVVDAKFLSGTSEIYRLRDQAKASADLAQDAVDIIAAAESTAQASADSAALSEAAASAHKDAASGSATAASSSETKAEQWASHAVDTLVPGETEYSAKHYQAKAAGNETASGASAVSAAQSEAAAEASAIASGASEADAQASASAASTSAANAQTAETGAVAAKNSAEQLFAQFGDQYLGSKATEPTVDNSGNPLTEGDVYWDSTSNVLKFYSGTAWVAPENIATTEANRAKTEADAAALSESAASGSASAAGASETNAGNSASAAASSASAAGTSETNAAGSASAASTSETNAAGSASAAAGSATSADNSHGYATEWANAAEDILISAAAGGDGVDDYSAKHWAAKASASGFNPASDQTITGSWEFTSALALPRFSGLKFGVDVIGGTYPDFDAAADLAGRDLIARLGRVTTGAGNVALTLHNGDNTTGYFAHFEKNGANLLKGDLNFSTHGIVIGNWQGQATYKGLLSGTPGASNFYMAMTNGTNTWVGAGAGGDVHLRGNNNAPGNQIVIPGNGGTPYIGSSYSIWHTGNDGAGSGMDADMIDGAHLSQLVRSDINNSVAGHLTLSNDLGSGTNSNTSASTLQVRNTGAGGNPCIAFHRPNAYAMKIGLDSDNVFGIGGWSAGSRKHEFHMNGNYVADGNITAYSDVRYKTNWKDLGEGFIPALSKVRVGTYDRIDAKDIGRQVGAAAQDFLPFIPEGVVNSAGKYTLAYGQLALVSSVELAKKVLSLEEKLSRLEYKIMEHGNEL